MKRRSVSGLRGSQNILDATNGRPLHRVPTCRAHKCMERLAMSRCISDLTDYNIQSIEGRSIDGIKRQRVGKEGFWVVLCCFLQPAQNLKMHPGAMQRRRDSVCFSS